MVQIKVRLDNDDHYMGGNTKEYIVWHDTGNYSDSDEGNANYFCTGTRNASAHYFVDPDSITQIVKDDDGSFNCGDGYGKNGIHNLNCIGIELCKTDGIIAEATKVNAIALGKMLMAKYNIPLDKNVRHYDASGKICPRSMSGNNWANWYSFKSRLGETSVQPTPPTVGELYRVRLSWKDTKSQIGAYSSLENAKNNCPNGYSVFASTGKSVYPIVQEVPPTNNKKYLYLRSHVSKWNVYPTNVAPVTGNQCGALNPSLFGGIEYEILGNPQTDVYTISTQSYGTVNIYVPKDGDSEFYTKGGSINYIPTPTPSNNKYLNLKPSVSSWRVYPLSKSPVKGNECGYLSPSQFGGLSYKILEDKGDIKIIKTSTFGQVQIYAPNDDDSSITNTPLY